MKVAEHVPFSELTTFKVGGVARYVLTLESKDEASEAVAFAKAHSLPVVPLGSGSNVFGPDGTLDAVLVRVAACAVDRQGDTLRVDAGALWDDVVSFAVTEGLWGIENLSAIPGTMGGAVVQNIGAYGSVLADSFVSVDVFDTRTMSYATLRRDACAFGYRTSVFKTERDRYIILSANLSLSLEAKPRISYPDLAKRFSGQPSNLVHIRQAVTETRGTKFPPLSEYGTAGSFFLNPIVDDAGAQVLRERFPEMPQFAMPEGGVKIPLGWIFDHVLKLRGYREGNVEAWREQALVVVAHPGATAGEVIAFAEKISSRVDNELGIKIFPEVRIL